MEKKNLVEIGKVVSFKALKTAYSNSGLEMYKPVYNGSMHQEFTQVAILGIWESYSHLFNEMGEMVETGNDSPEWKVLTKPGYAAINSYISQNRKHLAKHLYVEEMVENGETQYVDETVRITKSTFEMARLLKSGLTASEWKVLKYMALGYSTETIQNRMGYSTKDSTIRKMQNTSKTARNILLVNYGITSSISERTKTRIRTGK